MFLNTFTSLIHSSNTPATFIVKQACMTQLVRLCRMGHDHLVYPHLSKELVSVRTDSTPIDSTSLYAKALCIQEIITYRPDYYAQELLATISTLINICNQKAHAGISAILVDTMAVLCQTEVVDMVSTFSALHPQFKNEKRTLTLQAHCRFMSTLASLEHLCTADQADSFYERVIRILWSMSCNKTNEVEVNSAAFSALSKFKRAHFKCSFLNAYVQEALKERNRKLVSMEANKDKTIDEIFAAGVPASCYLDIFRHLDVRAYSGFKEFLFWNEKALLCVKSKTVTKLVTFVTIYQGWFLVPQALSEAHGELLTGHDGIYKTKERLMQCFYWPGMDADIASHLKSVCSVYPSM